VGREPGMTLIKQIINLIRIRRNPTIYDRGVLRHLTVNPKQRQDVKAWHEARVITGTECDR